MNVHQKINIKSKKINSINVIVLGIDLFLFMNKMKPTFNYQHKAYQPYNKHFHKHLNNVVSDAFDQFHEKIKQGKI